MRNLQINEIRITCGFYRPSQVGEAFLTEIKSNDANLNPGFDINQFRAGQLQLHNYYRSLHEVAPMTRDERYIFLINKLDIQLTLNHCSVAQIIYLKKCWSSAALKHKNIKKFFQITKDQYTSSIL